MLIVGVGGTLRPQSSSERALRIALQGAAERGAETMCFAGEKLDLPHYDPTAEGRPPAARALIAALREADGVILCSPGYHGGVSGLVKNALDYTEDMARDARTYFDGLPVGHVATAMGWQGATATIEGLRAITHALRGWPTPYACPLCVQPGLFDESGRCTDAGLDAQLRMVGAQVADFARQCEAHKRSMASVA